MIRDIVEVVLSSGESEVGVIPALGGALSHWRAMAADIFRPRNPETTDPIDSACFVLAPFSNAISDGILRFGDEHFALPRNHPKEPFFIHGDAWLGAWSILRVDKDFAEIRYDHDGERGFPFRYSVSQSIRIEGTKLAISLVLHNTGVRNMPAGLGIHPYFCKSKGARLWASHGGLWSNGAVRDDTRFLNEHALSEAGIDDCFVDWNGVACLTLQEWRRRVIMQASTSARALVVYSPPGSDFICIEPVTHLNDGINYMADGVESTGVEVLQPKSSMRLDVNFRVEPISEGTGQTSLHREPPYSSRRGPPHAI